jgi:predicted dehydrogenase
MNTRRSFLKQTSAAAAAFGFPTIIPSKVLGADAPSNQITLGAVGWGMQGPHNTMTLIEKGARCLAICDIDDQHRETAIKAINGKQKTNDCKGIHDYKELMARKDIDAVMLAVPDNWHALVATEAANHGKHIWGEKPLARSIAEQQAIVRAVEKNKVTWQTGSWQRSEKNFRVGAELVVNGVIGKLLRVEVGLPAGHTDFAKTGDKLMVTPPPAWLDYKTWIGPATMEDYIEGRIHKNWRWNYNIGGGQLLDWIGHHCDIAHWGMGMDRGGPVEMKPIQVDLPKRTDVWNSATKYRAEGTYANGVVMTIAGGHNDIQSGTKWIGDKGYIWVNRGGAFDTDIKGLGEVINSRDKDGKVKQQHSLPELGDDVIKTKLYDSPNHWANLLECIKSGKETITPVQTAHHSAIPGHLALISFLTNSTIKWDPATEAIVGNAEASKLLGRDYQNGFKLGA